MMIAQNVKRNLLTERSRSKIDGFHAVDISLTNTGVCVSVLARLSIFNVFYFLFVLLPLLLGVPFINNEVWIFFPSSLAVLLRYVHCTSHHCRVWAEFDYSTEFLEPDFVQMFSHSPTQFYGYLSTYFHFLQMHLSKKMIFHLEMVILHKNMKILDTIQKLVCKLGMKTHMHLPIGNHFLLYHVIIRPNKIKDPLKDCKSSIFKIRYFLKMCPIFASSLHSIGRWHDKKNHFNTYCKANLF